MTSSLGWACQKCTFYHTVPGTRCVMCETLRVTKAQMADFVMGKALVLEKASTGEESAKENPRPGQQPKIQNPYAKPKTTGAATCAVKAPPQQHQRQTTVQSNSTSLSQHSALSDQAGSRSSGTNFARQPQHTQRHMNPWEPKNNGTTDRVANGSSGENQPQNVPFRNTAPIHLKPTPRPASTGGQFSQRGFAIPVYGNVANGFVRNVAPPARSKPAPDSNNQTPFTMAVRPPRPVYVPGPVPLCPETASDWIYPIHQAYPIRDYQLEISKTAVRYNTLVSLPTGLGKTLIASVVLYNYYRWFPTGKAIFLAPTLPLVNQQVKACYDIMGIPARDTALLTGKVTANDRQVLWEERRVFFCTPQTVQRDIDSGKCPAQRVVCVVLDEAHKATGSYAYTKVVEQLEEAGARYRILGLSATPGTGIKQIQEVVTALRIHKIEARLEEDPSVKIYVHERHNEIVVVQQGSAITTIERLLNDLIAPLLERLRANNGLATIRGNATITPYCIVRAKEEYFNRTQDRSLDPYFFATLSLVSLRSDIRRTGIGMVRSKMLNLNNQPKGIMSSIVKGKEFKAVLNAVLQASSDPNSVNETAQDRKLNNPKLLKLDEILKEHFERARVSGESSRAIVFSQWRDSVSEIVSVLASSEPLLRPRHFVGQGKSSGGANKQNVDQTCVSLKGMKQKEQERVIKEFQEGKFNVLVATCIGEEGLDIGEVDLIVNYDTLRSPIRMIQRVGRTGRKRDGRVVCLVSEGQEERTMVSSKAAEKTLGRALKKPDNFSIVKSAPMFPKDPVLRQLDMSVSNEFHLSQVGGTGLGTKNGREASLAPRSRMLLDCMASWRLTEAQEKHREAILGDVESSSSLGLQSSDGSFPQVLRRRFWRARTRSLSSHRHRSKDSSALVGASRSILLAMERKFNNPKDNHALLTMHLISKARRPLREAGAFQSLFPLECQGDTAGSIWGLLKLSLSARSMEPEQVVMDQFNSTDRGMSSSQPIIPKAASANLPENPYRKVSNERGNAAKPPINERRTAHVHAEEDRPSPGSIRGEHVDTPWEAAARATAFMLPTQSDSSSSDVSDGNDEPENIVVTSPSVLRASQPEVECLYDTEERDDDVGADPVNDGLRGKDTKDSADVEVGGQEGRLNDFGEALCLPTQDSSSDEDSDRSQGARSSKEACHPPAVIHTSTIAGQYEPVNRDVSHDHFEEDLLQGLTKNVGASAKDQHENDEADRRLLDTPEDHGGRECSRSTTNQPSSNGLSTPAAEPCLSDGDSIDCDLIDTPCNDGAVREERRSKRLFGSKGIIARGVLAHTPIVKRGHEMRSKDAMTPFNPPRTLDSSGLDLMDTPQVRDNHRLLPPHSRTPASTRSQDTGPKDDMNNVVCAVCYDELSPEDNPIVLCDGPDNDLSCPIAVHKSCYSIDVSLDHVDNWYCDLCSVHPQQPSNTQTASLIRCKICRRKDGPLKHLSITNGTAWFHPYCQHAVVDHNACCQYCLSKGATKCAFDACTEYAHAHCGVTMAATPWLALAFKPPKNPSSTFVSGDAVEWADIYCSQHKDQVRRGLLAAGVDSVVTHASARYIVLPSTSRAFSTGMVPSKEIVKRKRLRKKVDSLPTDQQSISEAAANCRDEDSSETSDYHGTKRRRIAQRIQERTKAQTCRFLLHEADVEDDDDLEGDYDEDDEARRIEAEEEMFCDSFINDSSQLGYTQDELDRLDLSEIVQTPLESGAIHRAVDVAKERMNQFATPVFNRRMVKYGRNQAKGTSGCGFDEWNTTPQSAPSSEKGLGNMHFIRSVLEHHRNGGGADEIEDVYNMIAQEGSPNDEERPVPPSNPRGPIVMQYMASDSESSDSDEEAGDSVGNTLEESEPLEPKGANALTDDQHAMIEAKRQQALWRRQMLVKDR